MSTAGGVDQSASADVAGHYHGRRRDGRGIYEASVVQRKHGVDGDASIEDLTPMKVTKKRKGRNRVRGPKRRLNEYIYSEGVYY